MAVLAITLLFAPAQSHTGQPHCPSEMVHVDKHRHVSVPGSTDTGQLNDGCCGSSCTLCVSPLLTLSHISRMFEQGQKGVEPTSRLYGQIPVPARHPPRFSA